MTKKEAIEKYVSELNAIPQEWIRIVMEKGDEYHALPMWGTMWILSYFGETLYDNARAMAASKEDIDTKSMEDDEREKVEKAIADDDWSVLEQYIDEEMQGERCIVDKNGNTTAMYIYDISGEYVLGINGAGWNFYDGVWDKLYDIIGMSWHTS